MEEVQQVETAQVAITMPRKKIKHDPMEETSISFKVDPMSKGAIELEKQKKQREENKIRKQQEEEHKKDKKCLQKEE